MTKTHEDIEILARFLEGDGSLNGKVTGETRALARLAHRLESAATQPQPSRRQELRDQLLEEARNQQAAPPLRVRLRRWLEGVSSGHAPLGVSSRLAAVLAVAILVVSGSGVIYGSQAARPGQALYPVELTVEQARLAFADSPLERGQLHLEYAAERIQEAAASADVGDQGAAAAALRQANSSARAGAGALLNSYQTEGDAALITQVTTFTSTQVGRVTNLANGLNGVAKDTATETLNTFQQIQAQATALSGGCPECPEQEPAGGAAADEAPTAGNGSGVLDEPVEAAKPARPDGSRQVEVPQVPSEANPTESQPPRPELSVPGDASGEPSVRVPTNNPATPPITDEPPSLDSLDLPPSDSGLDGEPGSDHPLRPDLAEDDQSDSDDSDQSDQSDEEGDVVPDLDELQSPF